MTVRDLYLLLIGGVLATPGAGQETVPKPMPPPSASGVTVAPAVCAAPGLEDSAQRDPCTLLALRAEDDEVPVLDGVLSEAIWSGAQPATGFRQREPNPGDPASQRTEARVVYTDDAVYVGMKMFDNAADSIRAQFVRRDDTAAVSDWASVMLDSYHDRRTAFEFSTTPTGTRVDVLHLDDVKSTVTWDAVWEVATRRDADGWVAEFRIPLSQLRFAAGDDITWGVNFSRKLARTSEVAYWAPLPPTVGRVVSLYGDLVGLENLSPSGGVELLPYTVGRLNRAPGTTANPFYRANDIWGNAGLDVRYPITPNLILSGTVNPDFGQVEADPSKVNLTAFETFYAEKRPFFTEGTEIFDFRLAPEGYAFYSRRIGRSPQLTPSVEDGEYVESPQTARILGALKLSGKTDNGWSVGLMNAVTEQVNADVTTAGTVARQGLEPLTNYSAGRVIRDFRGGRSGLGILATAVNRRLNLANFESLRSASYTGAVDWWHRFGARGSYEFNGWLLGTHARGSADAMARTQRSASHFFIRPDADHLTYDPTVTSMNGWASELAVQKTGGGNVTWTLGGGSRSPGVELNDLGFLSYADAWYVSAEARYSQFIPGPVFRNWYVEGQYVQARTFGLELARHSLSLRTRGTFRNFWRVTVNTDRWFSHVWPWELRGGPALRRSPYTNVRWFVRSDSRKSWFVHLRGIVRFDDLGGSRIIQFDPLIDVRPTARATVSLGPILRWNRDADQYVARATTATGTEYIVGQVRQTTAAAQLRVSYGFSPLINLDVYAQPFVSTGLYSRFRTVADADAHDFDERTPLIPPSDLVLDAATGRYVTSTFSFRNPDFNIREFQLNAVLRWEYLPGSTIFVVWTQARQDYATLGAFDLGRDLDQLFLAPATNVFMVKVNYWIGM